MSILFIVNPKAGNGKALKVSDKIQEKMKILKKIMKLPTQRDQRMR